MRLGICRAQKHDVLRFEILVYQLLAMAVYNGFEDLLHHCCGPSLAHPPALVVQLFDDLQQLSTLRLLHSQIYVDAVLIVFEKLDDVRVIQHPQCLYFHLHLCRRHVGLGFVDGFQHPGLSRSAILDEVRHTESALPKFFLHLVDLERIANLLLDKEFAMHLPLLKALPAFDQHAVEKLLELLEIERTIPIGVELADEHLDLS
mmetsp:Transcript_78200/g.147627  ORF Transcript_78200/g.147627 Transcript_78200/m.147627 type:complete len:203 (-) Transcript_78200:334-942(-)